MLCSAVNNYITEVRGLPFFYAVGDSDYGTTLNEFVQNGFTIVSVSDYCGKPDKYPSVDDLIDCFRTSDVDYKTNKTVVVGLGEYLAIRGETEAYQELTRLKNTSLGNARVVLLLRCVSAQINMLITEDKRLVDQQRVFVSSSQTTSLSITNVDPGIGIAEKSGIKELLMAFEHGACGNQFVSTKLSLLNSIIPTRTIVTAYDAIKHYIEFFPLKQNLGTENEWKRLFEDVKKSSYSIEKVFSKYNLDDDFEQNLYEKVAGYEYRNWIAFVSLKYYHDKIRNSYLKYALDLAESIEEFRRKLLCAIINIKHTEARFSTFYAERKKLLKEFPESDVAIFIKENEIDPLEEIFRLTDNTRMEREKIIGWIASHGWNQIIEEIYPALGSYMKDYIFSCGSLSNQLTTYFSAYKHQKVENTISTAFMEMVIANAQELKYTRLDTRDNAVNAIPDKANVHLCWIDALGVEYLSYITDLARKKGLSIHIDITRCDLPSITSINRSFYEEWTGKAKSKIEDLDDIKHNDKGGFNYTPHSAAVHLARELEIIECEINRAATQLAMHMCRSYVIASDHGASRLAVIYQQEEKYETDTKGEHSGRCCKMFPDCDLPYVIPENNYLVLADYGRFKGSRAANVEVHGGASLEEVVVPIITLTLKSQTEIGITVLSSDSIIADRHTGTKMTIYITDVNNPNNICLVMNGIRYDAVPLDDTHFSITMRDIKRARSCSADVYDGADLIGNITFVVKGKTGSVNNDFDDLF